MHRDFLRTLARSAVAAAFLAGCGAADAEEPRETFTVRDSAGVRIVENSGPRWTPAERWRLGDEPALAIGMADGPPAYTFGRITGLLRTADGGVAVVDALASEVRWYDGTGRLLRSAGRKGGGPGEFQQVGGGFRFAGDTMAVGDWGSRRLTLFGPDGGLAGEASLSGDGDVFMYSASGSFGDGSILVQPVVMFRQGEGTGGVQRDSTSLARLDFATSRSSPLGRHPGSEMLVVQAANAMSVSSRAFGRSLTTAPSARGLFVGTGDAPEVVRYAMDGTPVERIRWRGEARPVTQQDIDGYRERRLAGPAAQRSMTEQSLAAMSYPDVMPFHGALMVDAAGHLWVQVYAADPDAPREWNVFDPDGVLLGTVVTPARFSVREIGEDAVAGVWEDDLDVQYVHVYALEKP
jgi:hypothetical protein